MSFGTRPPPEPGRRPFMRDLTEDHPPGQRQTLPRRDRPVAPEQTKDTPLRRQLLDLYDVLSHKIAGGQRVDHRNMLPGVDDPLEGIVPDDYRPEVSDLGRWFKPSEWAGLGPDDQVRADLAGIPAPATGGRDGDGMDFFRGGEAPDNYTNRNNPLYVARREFAQDINGRIEELFDVSSRGSDGHMRQPKASHKAPGGPSSNSDHYSGGAIDFFGDPDELDALRNWLVEQPFVSFVRWRTESHYDHVHASFDLGWIAQNYFEGREVPTVEAPSLPRGPSAPTGGTGTESGVSGAGRPV